MTQTRTDGALSKTLVRSRRMGATVSESGNRRARAGSAIEPPRPPARFGETAEAIKAPSCFAASD